jgi:hypothetical protein
MSKSRRFPAHAPFALFAMVATACGAPEAGDVAQAALQASSGALFQVWEREHAYQGNRDVWDPSVMRTVSVDHNLVYNLDTAPYFLHTDRREMWTTDYRCWHASPTDLLGWHLTPQASYAAWQYGPGTTDYCQRVDWNPWGQTATYFADHRRWWTLATGATWGAIETWSNGSPVNFTVVRFSENKSMFGADGKLRRGAPGPGDHDYWGYADRKMNGDPTRPELNPNNVPKDTYDDVEDGFYQGFITLGTIPVNAATNWGMNAMVSDAGPIIWPRHGYRQWRSDLATPPGHGANWQQTSRGVRQAHLFQWGGNLYVYYWQEAGIDAHGYLDPPEEAGIFVAHAPISATGWVGSFSCGPQQLAVPCMPAGYSNATHDAWQASLALPGPVVSPIIGSGASGTAGAVPNQFPGVVSFAVAALAGTSPQRFVGVAEAANKIELFTSDNLTEWKHVSTAYSWSASADWKDGSALHYPQLVRASDGDMTTVDPAQFYIVGSNFRGCSGWPCTLQRVSVSNLSF